MDVARHGVADVDALGAGRDHKAPGIAVVHQKVHVVRRDFVGGQFHPFSHVEFRGVGIDETLDFFGCHQAVALVVQQNIDHAAVAPLEFSQLLLVGQEQVLVQPPVQERSHAVYVLDFQHGEFSGLGVRLLEGCDRAVFAVHIHEHVQDFAFFQGEFVPVSGEQHPAAGFQLQVIPLGHDAFDPGAIVFADFHKSLSVQVSAIAGLMSRPSATVKI